MDNFDAFVKKNISRTRQTTINGCEIVRLNKSGAIKLQAMIEVTKISKRSLASYAILLLYDEYIKWQTLDPNHKFGYLVEEKDGQQDKIQT